MDLFLLMLFKNLDIVTRQTDSQIFVGELKNYSKTTYSSYVVNNSAFFTEQKLQLKVNLISITFLNA